MILDYTLLAIGITFGVFGQLSLKHGMNTVKNKGLSGIRFIVASFTNGFVLLGLAFYGSSTGLWLVIISRLELSFAYPMISAGYIVVVLLSKIFFKETVSLRRWAGVFAIALGVLLITRSA